MHINEHTIIDIDNDTIMTIICNNDNTNDTTTI